MSHSRPHPISRPQPLQSTPLKSQRAPDLAPTPRLTTSLTRPHRLQCCWTHGLLSCRAAPRPIPSCIADSGELPSPEHGHWRNKSDLYIDGRRPRPSTSSVHPANVKRSKQPGSLSASSVGEPSTAGRISNCAAGCQLSGMTNDAVIPDLPGSLHADSDQQPPPPQASQQPYPNPPGSASAPPPPGEMVTLPPPQHQQQQDFYRHPPYDMYPAHPQDPMRGPPPPHLYQSQPAPRQRTAIACRYCRRRKVS